jgi:hypothetical protein
MSLVAALYMQPMRRNHLRSKRFATRPPDALVGLVRLLARQAAREVIGSEKRLHGAVEPGQALPDQPMGSTR